MSDINISKVMNGKSPAFSVSMSDEQVMACDYAINNYDKLVFSLDDMTMYCADTDMKNAELTARNAELEAALSDAAILIIEECGAVMARPFIEALKDNS